MRLLEAALWADDPGLAPQEPELARARDSCVARKGCKRGCEASVDMALIKAEYLAQRRRQQGPGAAGLAIRPRAALAAPRGRRPRRGLRLAQSSDASRAVASRVLGLALDRAVPPRAPRPFAASAAHRGLPTEGARGSDHQVVPFVDTFARHFEPNVARPPFRCRARAAIRHAPWRPRGASDRSRGRTYLVQGLIEEARAGLERVLEALRPALRGDAVIVGLEAVARAEPAR